MSLPIYSNAHPHVRLYNNEFHVRLQHVAGSIQSETPIVLSRYAGYALFHAIGDALKQVQKNQEEEEAFELYMLEQHRKNGDD